MPNFTPYLTESQPEIIAWVASRKSVSTGTITRGSGSVSAKTVRLETLSRQREMADAGGTVYQIDAMILAAFGAGFLPGDRFTIASQAFEIVIVMPGMTDNEQCYLRLRR